MINLLDAMRVAEKADGPALGIYCVAYSRWIEARKELKGAIVRETDLGGIKSNPAAEVVKQAESIMLRVLAEFGFTPASRSKVAHHHGAPRDELGEFLSAREGEHAGPRRWRNVEIGVSHETVESARSTGQFARRGGHPGRKATHR
jgi:P27 family predicted phage terminase small subunit